MDSRAAHVSITSVYPTADMLEGIGQNLSWQSRKNWRGQLWAQWLSLCG